MPDGRVDIGRVSTRAMLRALQRVRRDACGPAFEVDIRLLQAKDLDLSVRLGALLAFDALLIGTVINPITASPGAPVSLDAGRQPLEVVVVTLAVLLVAVAAGLCVRAVTIGEEFTDAGVEDDADAIARRVFAAYCRSIDAQRRLLRLSAGFTVAGAAVGLAATIWIMAAKALS